LYVTAFVFDVHNVFSFSLSLSLSRYRAEHGAGEEKAMPTSALRIQSRK